MTNKFIKEQQELARNSFHENFYFSGVKYKKTNKVWKDGHKETLVNKELNTTVATIIENTGKELERRMESLRTGYPDVENDVLFEQGFESCQEEAIQITKEVTGRELK